MTCCCCSTLYSRFLLCLTCLPFKSCRRGWSVLVREQRRAGVLGRWGPWGFLPGAPGARSPRLPRQERQIPAWGPGRHAEGRRTQPEQLGPVGVLVQPNISPNLRPDSDSSHCWVDQLLFTNQEPASVLHLKLNSVAFWGERHFFFSFQLQRGPTENSEKCKTKKSLDEVNNVLSQCLTLKQQN